MGDKLFCANRCTDMTKLIVVFYEILQKCLKRYGV